MTDDRRQVEFVDRMAQHRARFESRVMESIQDELAPRHLVPVHADVRDILDRLLHAAFQTLRNGEQLDEETALLVRRTAERWCMAEVPFATVIAIASAAARAGVDVTRQMTRDRELALSLVVVGRGVVVAQEILSAAALGYQRGLSRAPAPASPVARLRLRPRAGEVLRLVAEGRRDTEIAAELEVSKQTASYHVGRLMRLLGAVNRTALVARAYEQGLLPRA